MICACVFFECTCFDCMQFQQYVLYTELVWIWQVLLLLLPQYQQIEIEFFGPSIEVSDKKKIEYKNPHSENKLILQFFKKVYCTKNLVKGHKLPHVAFGFNAGIHEYPQQWLQALTCTISNNIPLFCTEYTSADYRCGVKQILNQCGKALEPDLEMMINPFAGLPQTGLVMTMRTFGAPNNFIYGFKTGNVCD